METATIKQPVKSFGLNNINEWTLAEGEAQFDQLFLDPYDMKIWAGSKNRYSMSTATGLKKTKDGIKFTIGLASHNTLLVEINRNLEVRLSIKVNPSNTIAGVEETKALYNHC
ncbi:hypothetical protein D3C81_1692020 [compost metagenome]